MQAQIQCCRQLQLQCNPRLGNFHMPQAQLKKKKKITYFSVICVFKRFSPDFFFFVFLGLYPWHMEVPRLEVKLELQLSAYTTANSNTGSDLGPLPQLMATPSLNPMSEARD